MTKGVVVFSAGSCRACRVCEVACSLFKEAVAGPSVSRINIHFREFDPAEPIRGTICRQCEVPECMEACAAGAMWRDASTGSIVINQGMCIGCMECKAACPWQVPKLHTERGVAIKCDLCKEREEGPACVEACPLPGKALRYDAAGEGDGCDG
jgi:Fe-S-cluster-containing dehydrogenase component